MVLDAELRPWRDSRFVYLRQLLSGAGASAGAAAGSSGNSDSKHVAAVPAAVHSGVSKGFNEGSGCVTASSSNSSMSADRRGGRVSAVAAGSGKRIGESIKHRSMSGTTAAHRSCSHRERAVPKASSCSVPILHHCNACVGLARGGLDGVCVRTKAAKARGVGPGRTGKAKGTMGSVLGELEDFWCCSLGCLFIHPPFILGLLTFIVSQVGMNLQLTCSPFHSCRGVDIGGGTGAAYELLLAMWTRDGSTTHSAGTEGTLR